MLKPDESVDWCYSMRRDMQEIISGLFLGPYASAMKAKLSCLLDRGITHIVCIRQSIESHFIRPNFPDTFRYLVLDIADTFTENIIRYFSQFRDFIDECFQRGGRVLVHGNGGISRSASLVIAYVMEKFGLSYRNASAYVQQRRFCINPNEHFCQQLKEFEALSDARRIISCDQGPHKGSLKRKYENDTEEDLHMDEEMS
ncbi:hypothetical protein DPMN_095657 [Dreissena polymorpha]|uniref:Serine/threonine/tyrosine-interacting protein n=2 Tax=Dreissena polymorpha TaxID=45954 RepID=A0A9D4L804_DREPO|nr:hypothetical protein DPMN_095657 [Dreissena polymorpha]